MRTVALYQTGSDKDGSTVYYEFGRAVLRDDAQLHLTAFHQEDLQRWIKQGVPVKHGYVPAREGDAFLSALRDDYSKGGRTFALDSQTETIPPSLFLVPGSRKFEETIPVKIPRGASARQENALHRAADAHLDDLTALMIAAFNKGRAVIRKDPQNATGAIEAVKKYLHATLPETLLTIHDDGGTVAMDRLIAMRTAGGAGSGNFGHTGRPGEIGGSGEGAVVFHGTTQNRLDSIKKTGINASYAGAVWPSFSEKGYTYVTNNRSEAENWAREAAERWTETHLTDGAPPQPSEEYKAAVPVVLEVAIPKSELPSLGKDVHFEYPDMAIPNDKFQFKGDIKPEWIRQGWMLQSTGKYPTKELYAPGIPWVKALAETSTDDDVVILYLPFALIPHEPKAAASKRTFDSGSDAAVSWADQHAAELIDNISENSREDIGNAIAAAIEDGDLSGAMDDILDAVGDKTRAELIARTEIMRAVNAGQREAWNQAVDDGLLTGDEQRTWIATDDELTCPICNDLDGETIGLDEQYSDGSDGPPAHPRCRCTEGIVGVA
jgi:SPP1 gp7 family putative phage head morphogenesis protein